MVTRKIVLGLAFLTGVVLLTGACSSDATSVDTAMDETESATTPTTFGLHVVWLKGEGEANRPALDAFVDYLLEDTNLTSYWGGAANIVHRSTTVVAAPSTIPSCGSPCSPHNTGPWLTKLINAKELPAPLPGEVPIYEILVDHTVTKGTVLSQSGVGGENGIGTVAGHRAGLFFATTNTDHFWSGRKPLADETIVTEHELAENVNLLLGRAHGGLIGDGVCQFPTCSPDRALGVGPTSITTGDGCGHTVKGWLVQPLAKSSDQWNGVSPTTCTFILKNTPPPAPKKCGSTTCATGDFCWGGTKCCDGTCKPGCPC